MGKYPVFIVFIIAVATMCFTATGCSDKKPVADTIGTDTTGTDTTGMDTMAEDTLESIIAATPMPKAADELFDDFIFNFAANRKLQFKRIRFPLLVKDGDKASYVDKSRWKMEYFFMRQGYYSVLFDNERQINLVKDTTIKHVVIEKIYLTQSAVKQFIFDRIGGLWTMTAINNSGINQNANASFLRFYQRFSVDSAFQVRSMNSTVEFTSPDPDDDFNSQTGVIVPEQWSSFMPALIPKRIIYNIIYGQKYASNKQKVFVIRGIANGLEEILVFRNFDGAWKLVKFNG